MKWIISNHKNNLNEENLQQYKEELKNINTSNINFIICPSCKQIALFSNMDIELGSQDISFIENDNKNLTPSELKRLGIGYAIIGHAEIKKLYNQSNSEINKKIKLLIKNNIRPIICLGEDITQRDIQVETVITQLTEYLQGINDVSSIIIAYEPIWAINSGIIPEEKELETVIEAIKDHIYTEYNQNIPILYGGSINKETIKQINKITSIDGYLIGRSSLDLNELKEIVKEIV